ncbi:hypothetical protein GGF46_003482 [Coemansia sp. RSA 552]|nr:hypothetical protein GGF46_003482 [Coemansia sp. RSA 552]
MLARAAGSASLLLLLTLACWLYAFHLYRAANLLALRRHPCHLALSLYSQLRVALSLYSQLRVALNLYSQLRVALNLYSRLRLGDSSDGILTFIHASDIHISKFWPLGGLPHFLHFLHTAVPLVSPRVVAVTGDLTDAKDKQKLTSQQQPDEWRAYQRALDLSGVKTRFNGTFYRDQRGNHDCFNVFSTESDQNYYRSHSAVGDSSGYLLQIRESFGTYSFVASDGCPSRGFARPLNFFGYLDGHDMELLEHRLGRASGSNHTFLLNHYPVSTMLFGRHSKAFSGLVGKVSVFLCGHLHQLTGGLGAQLQAYKVREGYWELELGDMKEHALYRVYAIDNDLVSFVDVTLPLPQIPMPNPGLLDFTVDGPIPHPPVVLVTNPKDARYLLPAHEPLHRIRTSQHIRILAWADQPVASVTIRIDGRLHEHPAVYRGKEDAVGESADASETVKTPLWVARWDPMLYDDGQVHELEVTVADTEGKSTVSKVPFTLGNESVALGNGARGGWIMQQDFASLFRVSGLVSYLLMAACLLVGPRVYYLLRQDFTAWAVHRAVGHHKSQVHVDLLWTSIRGRGWRISSPLVSVKLLLALLAAKARLLVWTQFTALVYLASVWWLFWPAYFFSMGIAVLPLFVGRLIPSAPGSDGMGSVYVFGIYIAGEWVPLLDSWTYALASIVSVAVLLLHLSAAVAPPSLFYSTRRGNSKLPWYRHGAVKGAMALFVFVYLGIPSAMTFYTYGWASVFLGFGRAWLFCAACTALYLVDWRQMAPATPPEYTRPPSEDSARLDQ